MTVVPPGGLGQASERVGPPPRDRVGDRPGATPLSSRDFSAFWRTQTTLRATLLPLRTTVSVRSGDRSCGPVDLFRAGTPSRAGTAPGGPRDVIRASRDGGGLRFRYLEGV